MASGGLSNLEGLCEAFASLAGKPVERSAEPEGTARGLAWLLADRPAHWTFETDRVFDPAPCPVLHRRYADWSRRLAVRLEGVY